MEFKKDDSLEEKERRDKENRNIEGKKRGTCTEHGEKGNGDEWNWEKRTYKVAGSGSTNGMEDLVNERSWE